MNEHHEGDPATQLNTRKVARRNLLRVGSLATAITGITAIPFLDTRQSAHAAPGDKNPATTYIPTTEKGAAAGVASLDANAKVAIPQLPDLSATYKRRDMGCLNIKEPPYNANGDGKTIDRIPIQNAIIDANRAYKESGVRQTVEIPSGVFLVDAVGYSRADGSNYGATSLYLLDGVELVGVGTIKVKPSCYGTGAFYRVISSQETGVSNAKIQGITIDGNRTSQIASKQCSNIVLEVNNNVAVDTVTSINANGHGMMLRGSTNQKARNIRISGNTIADANCIGIQASHFDGLVISNNYVTNTQDNCIDIYGEAGTLVANANNFVISGNVVQNGLVGIFPETVREGLVTANSISRCQIGIAVNRINGEPKAIVLSGNIICSCATGIRVTGDTGGVQIRGNYLTDFSGRGVQLGSTDGNISRVSVEGNDLHPSTPAIPLLTIAGRQAAWLRARNNSTSGTDRSLDVVNAALSNVQNVMEPPYGDRRLDHDQEITVTDIPVPSGGSFTISVPGNTSGILTIKGTAGGGWQSTWVGAIASGAASVSASPLTTLFTSPGNSIREVHGSNVSLEIAVSAGISGSAGLFAWTYRYI